MIRSNFLSRDDRRELLSCVKRQREDHGVARRANALLLLDDGKSCVEIAQVLYLDDDTVRGWHKQYLSEGWDTVAYDGWKGGQSRLREENGIENRRPTPNCPSSEFLAPEAAWIKRASGSSGWFHYAANLR